MSLPFQPTSVQPASSNRTITMFGREASDAATSPKSRNNAETTKQSEIRSMAASRFLDFDGDDDSVTIISYWKTEETLESSQANETKMLKKLKKVIEFISHTMKN